MRNDFNFGIRVETNDRTGEIMSVYWSIRKGKSATVKEFADGAAFADYSTNGKLLGIELLEPCSVAILDRIAVQEPAKKFLRDSIPRSMLAHSRAG